MLLEAVQGPIRYRLRDGREIRLEPGQAVDLPDEQASKLLTLAGAKVRVVPAPVGAGTTDPLADYCPTCGAGYWLKETPDSPWTCGRCTPLPLPVHEVLCIPGGTPPPALPRIPAPAEADMQAQPGEGMVWWEGADGQRYGPGAVELLADMDGWGWLGVTYEGNFRWIRQDLVRRYRRQGGI